MMMKYNFTTAIYTLKSSDKWIRIGFIALSLSGHYLGHYNFLVEIIIYILGCGYTQKVNGAGFMRLEIIFFFF